MYHVHGSYHFWIPFHFLSTTVGLIPSLLLVFFFRRGIIGPTRKSEISAEIKITHNMRLNAYQEILITERFI